MEWVPLKKCLSLLRTRGRVLWQEDTGRLYLNWTCSQVEVNFRGTCLVACLRAESGLSGQADGPLGEHRVLWPWAAVLEEDREDFSRRFQVDDKSPAMLLWFGPKPETRRLRLVKLTENQRTALALEGFWMEGELLPPEPSPARGRIEFVGDSITCGYGNEGMGREKGYYSAEENGWLTYGALTARALGLEASMISISGICLAPRQGKPERYSMRDIYSYTDRVQEDNQGRPSLTPWDFKAAPLDYLVMNLGANDAMGVANAPDPEAERECFERDYEEFLYRLRELNGPRPWVVCALGPIGFELLPGIERAVRRYQNQSGDGRISLLRLPGIEPTDPVGPWGHPHWVTHQKMALALEEHLRRLPR